MLLTSSLEGYLSLPSALSLHSLEQYFLPLDLLNFLPQIGHIVPGQVDSSKDFLLLEILIKETLSIFKSG